MTPYFLFHITFKPTTMKTSKLAAPLVAVALLAGAGAGVASLASAQSSPTTTTAASAATGTSNTQANRHAPLGGDGNITSINGTTIVMAEEADEGGTSYTIDGSKAVVTKDGAASTLSALAVGDKIFVEGATSGTNIVATAISNGHGGRGGHKPDNDTETNDQ